MKKLLGFLLLVSSVCFGQFTPTLYGDSSKAYFNKGSKVVHLSKRVQGLKVGMPYFVYNATERGKEGVVASWPYKIYPTYAAMNKDTKQRDGKWAGNLEDGYVYKFDKAAKKWVKTSLGNWYLEKIIGYANIDTVVSISSTGKTVTGKHKYAISEKNAVLVIDNTQILKEACTYHKEVELPTGRFYWGQVLAIGDYIHNPGLHIYSKGKTELAVPRGVLGSMWLYDEGLLVENISFVGNQNKTSGLPFLPNYLPDAGHMRVGASALVMLWGNHQTLDRCTAWDGPGYNFQLWAGNDKHIKNFVTGLTDGEFAYSGWQGLHADGTTNSSFEHGIVYTPTVSHMIESFKTGARFIDIKATNSLCAFNGANVYIDGLENTITEGSVNPHISSSPIIDVNTFFSTADAVPQFDTIMNTKIIQLDKNNAYIGVKGRGGTSGMHIINSYFSYAASEDGGYIPMAISINADGAYLDKVIVDATMGAGYSKPYINCQHTTIGLCGDGVGIIKNSKAQWFALGKNVSVENSVGEVKND